MCVYSHCSKLCEFSPNQLSIMILSFLDQELGASAMIGRGLNSARKLSRHVTIYSGQLCISFTSPFFLQPTHNHSTEIREDGMHILCSGRGSCDECNKCVCELEPVSVYWLSSLLRHTEGHYTVHWLTQSEKSVRSFQWFTF